MDNRQGKVVASGMKSLTGRAAMLDDAVFMLALEKRFQPLWDYKPLKHEVLQSQLKIWQG